MRSPNTQPSKFEVSFVLLDIVPSTYQVPDTVPNQQSGHPVVMRQLRNVPNILTHVPNIPLRAGNKKGTPKCPRYVANTELMRVGEEKPPRFFISSRSPTSIVEVPSLNVFSIKTTIYRCFLNYWTCLLGTRKMFQTLFQTNRWVPRRIRCWKNSSPRNSGW